MPTGITAIKLVYSTKQSKQIHYIDTYSEDFLREVFEFLNLSGIELCVYVCMFVPHHNKRCSINCSKASKTPITIHILKAYDKEIIREHKYKDKDTDKVPETPNI